MGKQFKWEYDQIRTTDSSTQQKKHQTQMTQEELDYLYRLLTKSMRQDSYYKILPKLERKMKTKIKIDIQDLLTVLNEAGQENIIEYNETVTGKHIERRLLIRSNTEFMVNGDTPSHLCIVYAPDNKRFVTAYFNMVRDRHQTLREEIYNRDLIIIKES